MDTLAPPQPQIPSSCRDVDPQGAAGPGQQKSLPLHEAALAGHVDVAFETLDAGIRAAAASCGMPPVEKRDRAVHRAHAPFFDAECQALKRHVQAMANRCSNPSELRAMERRYHSLVRSKRRAYRVAYC